MVPGMHAIQLIYKVYKRSHLLLPKVFAMDGPSAANPSPFWNSVQLRGVDLTRARGVVIGL